MFIFFVFHASSPHFYFNVLTITPKWRLHTDTSSHEQWLHLCVLLTRVHVVWLQEMTFATSCMCSFKIHLQWAFVYYYHMCFQMDFENFKLISWKFAFSELWRWCILRSDIYKVRLKWKLQDIRNIEMTFPQSFLPLLVFKLRVSNVGSPACDNNVWVIKKWVTIIFTWV